MGPTNETKTASSPWPALPPIADLVSREIRRMGRAWKIESVKSALHVLLTMMAIKMFGVVGFMALTVGAVTAWFMWSRFTIKATVRPYRWMNRKSRA